VIDMELPGTFSTLKGLGFGRAIPQQINRTGKLQHVPRRKVDEQQPRLGIHQEIAKRVEQRIAVIVEDRQRIAFDLDKARLAAAMTGIDATGVA